MSVGHVARILEDNGIATVIIAVASFKDNLESMHLPRVLLTPFPLGRPIGFPNNKAQHIRVIKAALNRLNNVTDPKTVTTINEQYFSAPSSSK